MLCDKWHDIVRIVCFLKGNTAENSAEAMQVSQMNLFELSKSGWAQSK